MGKPILSLIIPAFNERRRMQRRKVLERYHSALSDRCGDDFEIIVVANGCTDGSEVWLQEQQGELPHLRCLSITEKGKGFSLMAGFNAACGALVAFTDADGASPAKSIFDVVDRLSEFDAAIGSRYSPGSKLFLVQPVWRRVVGRIARFYIRLLFPLRFDDMLCGCKAFRRDALEEIEPLLFEGSAAIDINILYALSLFGRSIVEVPIGWEHIGGSTIRLHRLIRWPFELFRIRRKLDAIQKLEYHEEYRDER